MHPCAKETKELKIRYYILKVLSLILAITGIKGFEY
jgi:hypothetical protein